MSRTLILYYSKYGQTRKIAEYMAAELRRAGDSVLTADVAKVPLLTPVDFDRTIVGAPVYARAYPYEIRLWLEKNASVLSGMPSFFFSVCLGVLQPDKKVQDDLRKIVENFFSECGWWPEKWELFPGALSYTKYNWIVRLFMRYIARQAGGDTDASRDYEYTDWAQVRRFTQGLLVPSEDKDLNGP